MRIEHVDAHQRQIRAGHGWLFHKLFDGAIRVQLRHAKVLRVWHARQHNLAVPRRAGKLLDQRTDAALDYVVAKEHHEALGAKERAGNLHCMRQAGRLVLLDVRNVHTPAAAIAHRFAHLGAGFANHNANLVHTGIANGANDAKEHGLVGNWNKLLGARVGERI